VGNTKIAEQNTASFLQDNKEFGLEVNRENLNKLSRHAT